MLNKIRCTLAVVLVCHACFAQQSDFNVAINNRFFTTGDTLELAATYSVAANKLPPATLDIIIENERGNSWNIRWPMTDGRAEGSIILSKFIPAGKYHVWIAVQPRVFRIYGQMVYCSRKKTKSLETMMEAGNIRYLPQQIKLKPDNSFLIKDWVLTNEMTLGFTTGNPEDVLHIHPECWLDSAYRPAAQSYVSVLINNANSGITEKPVIPPVRPIAWRGTGAYNQLDPAAIYNHFYSKGLFSDTSEIIIDVMGDMAVRTGTNTIQYVADKLLENGIAVEKNDNKLWYNGRELTIFFNEALSLNPLSGIALNDIAIIKFVQHYVSTGNENGPNALAIYPKRYPFTDAGIAQNFFRVKGYDDEMVLLR